MSDKEIDDKILYLQLTNARKARQALVNAT